MIKKSKKPPGKSRSTRATVRKAPVKTPPAKTKARERQARGPRKLQRRRRTMRWTTSSMRRHALGLPVEPQRRPAIKANLDVTLRPRRAGRRVRIAGRGGARPVFGA
jgi:hypothetical protein